MNILKVREKGIIIIPKAIRDEAGIKEGDEVIAEADKETIILRKFSLLRVRIERNIIDELIREDLLLEERKYAEIFERKDNTS